MRVYKYKAYHLPSGKVFEKTIEQATVHEGIIVLSHTGMMELMNRWNYIATLQPTLQWLYVAQPDSPDMYPIKLDYDHQCQSCLRSYKQCQCDRKHFLVPIS